MNNYVNVVYENEKSNMLARIKIIISLNMQGKIDGKKKYA